MARHGRTGGGSAGCALTLDLAPTTAGPVRATVRPLDGHDELALAEAAATAPSRLPVARQSLILDRVATLEPAGLDSDALLLGDRNRLLLAALLLTFGAPDELLVTCPDPACASREALPFEPAPMLDCVPDGPADVAVALAGLEAALRLPTGADLRAAAGAPDALLARCVEAAPDVPAATLAAAVEAELARRDPCAEIMLVGRCSTCGGEVAGVVEPLGLLEQALGREGGILVELDAIASTYHWSEAEILSLPARRRRHYLQLIAAASLERRVA